MDRRMEGESARAGQVELRTRAVAWCALLVAAAVTIVRCIRPPDGFALTGAIFTCDVAPKRCAFGQALALLHVPAGHLAVYSIVALSLLLTAMALYGLAAVRSGLTGTATGLVIMASFAASYGFGVFVSLNGSLDVPMAILAVAGLLVPQRLQAPTIAIAAVLGVLVHEAYLIVFLPVTLLPLLLRIRKPRDLAAPLLIGVMALSVVLLSALERPMTPAQAEQTFRLLQAKADFPVQGYSVAVLHRSLSDNLAMMAAIERTPWFWRMQLANAVLLAPAAGLFTAVVCLGWRSPALAKLAALAAAASPLAMNALGYDVLRWGGLCVLTMTLSLCAVAQRYGPPRLMTPAFQVCAALFAFVPFLLPAPYSHQAGAPPEVQKIIQQS